ncbi:MAG: exo-alpha-sialidase [Anaerolineae bacterium]
MNARIKLVHCDTLCCEPILRRMIDGSLLCVSQCGDLFEPAPGNRVYAFRSEDQGESWKALGSVYPETGEAVGATEVMVFDGVVSAFLQVHTGRFLNMRCVVMQSRDSGRTWMSAGSPPYFPTFCFVRSMVLLANGEIVLPCQYFPVSQEENIRLVVASQNIANPMYQRSIWDAAVDHVGNDVIISADGGKTFVRFAGPKIAVKGTTGRGWAWTEPTLAQLSDGRIVMLLRVDGSGCLWRSESRDLGRTWTEAVKTDIPNPGNKPKLIPMKDGRVALIHTPNPNPGFSNRYPLSLWISDDDLASFRDKRVVTDFPGNYCYPDGFFEYGHILFTIEINRRDILFVDCEV